MQRRLGRVEPAARAWADDARRAFLDTYRAVIPDGLLDEALLPGLETEQLLAELRYAHRCLPRWEYAPDGVLTFRYPPGPLPEEPWTPPPSEPSSS